MGDADSGSIVVSRRAMQRVLAAVAAIIVLVLLALFVVPAIGRILPGSGGLPSEIDQHEYQAVFLSNGQVYFGKLSGADSRYYFLRHVYFLQSGSTSRTQGAGQQVLVQLTKEVHGPEDLLVIDRRQVLFIENLRPSGCAARLLSGSPC